MAKKTKVIVTNTDTYVVFVTEEKLEQLKSGRLLASELIEHPEAFWKNGSCEYDIIGEEET